jgi:hypothetical protein
MTRNLSKTGPLRVPTLVVNLELVQALPPHGLDNTPASSASWPQEIVCTLGNSKLRPHETTTKTKALTT